MTRGETTEFRRELTKLIATALASNCFESDHGTNVIINAVPVAEEITQALHAIEKKELEEKVDGES